VITICHRAWLAWRSPPGLSRWRLTFPEEAGIGAAVGCTVAAHPVRGMYECRAAGVKGPEAQEPQWCGLVLCLETACGSLA
jgi:hypothetical protein